MIKTLISITAAVFLGVTGALAATFEYDVRITAITGDGEAKGIGFFTTGAVGDPGTGSARTDFEVPTSIPMMLSDDSLFGVTFPGIATAASFFANPVVHDPIAGTVTVDGFLGGLTGPYPEFISADAFSFVYQGAPGAAFGSIGDYENFLANATMSGFVSAVFFDDEDNGFRQQINFEAVTTSPVPLPAGALLLLSGIGLLAIKRRKSV